MEINMAGASYFAYEDLTVSGTAVGGTAATYSNANYATILVESASVRFKFGTPTATSGDVLNPGDRIVLESQDEVSRIKFISKDGSSATLRCHYGVR